MAESADDLKALGNKAFQAGQYDEAIKHFSEAIAIDGENHVLYSNRSAAFASQKDYRAALADADKTIAIKPDWAKGYGRRGAALFGVGQFEEAIEAYSKGLELDAGNKQLSDGLASAKEALEKQQAAPPPGATNIGDMFNAASIAKLKSHPQTAQFFKDPGFAAQMEMVSGNPGLLSSMLSDPRIMTCLGVVMGVDIKTAAPGDKADPDAMIVESDDEEEESPKPAEPAKKPTPAPEPEPTEEEEMPTNKKEAAAEKEKGTAAYKQKDFDTALKHYGAAAALDPTDPVFLLNQGAVYYEMKNYEKCREVCQKAKDVGMDHQCDFKLLAKADARIAKAFQAEGNLEDAIKNYDRALTNHRCAEYLNAKKKLEKEFKEKKRQEYIDPVKSQEAKDRGNAFFRDGKWPDAIKEYTEAILRNPDDGKLYSNRAAAYTKLAEFPTALKDCEECIRLEPTFIKGYLRKGNVLLGMQKATEAEKAYRQAGEIDANHPEVREGLAKCQQLIYGGGMSREERVKAAMSDPEVQIILQDPVIQQILQQAQERPGALQEHMKNDGIRQKIEKLAQAGILQFR